MPAKSSPVTFLSRILRAKATPWILAVIAIAALATWANGARAAGTTSSSSSEDTPVRKLAAGTLNLEGTANAVDAAAAANLLPLWQLLEQLESSDAAAPQEITAVVEEIRLNMTAAQIKAIDATSVDDAVSGSRGASSSAASTTKASTQASSAAVGPQLGGDITGGAPMDAGGPMPSGSTSQSASTTKSSASSASTIMIKQVIQLLESKVQS